MKEIKVIETGNYIELIPLFREAGLEMHLSGDKTEGMITCWKAEDENHEIVGGVTIEQKRGCFTIGDIAVKEEMRNLDLGTKLVETAVERIRWAFGREIYIVAKAHKFFEKFGFVYISAEEVPTIFNCKTCDQRGFSCFPEFMKKV